MGMDAHFFIEYKKEGQGWELDPNHIDETDPISKGQYLKQVTCIHRDHLLLGLLGGPRSGPGTAMIDRRGLPNDISDKLKKEWEDRWKGNGGHSTSWVSIEEFEMVLNEYERIQAEDPEIERSRKKYGNPRKKLKKITTKPFYKYEDVLENNLVEPTYRDMLTYMKQQIKERTETVEDIIDINCECRLVFWFDS